MRTGRQKQSSEVTCVTTPQNMGCSLGKDMVQLKGGFPCPLNSSLDQKAISNILFQGSLVLFLSAVSLFLFKK